MAHLGVLVRTFYSDHFTNPGSPRGATITSSSAGGLIARRWASHLALTTALMATVGCNETYRHTQIISNEQPRPDTSTPASLDAAPSSPAPKPDAGPDVLDAATDAAPDSAIVDAAAPSASAPDSSVPDAQAPDAAVVPPDAATATPDAELPPAEPLAEGVPPVTGSIADVNGALDLFGSIGNRFWFVATENQVAALNAELNAGGGGYYGGDRPYTPQSGSIGATQIEHVVITPAGDDSVTADFGKVLATLPFDSIARTGREWTASSLPNFELNFGDDPSAAPAETLNLSLHNALAGSIFREKLATTLLDAMGYPTQQVNLSWVSSTVWEPDQAIPYVTVEPYSQQYCDRVSDTLGGCTNLWGSGDNSTNLYNPGECLLESCDTSRLEELSNAVSSTGMGPGFAEALSEWVDWNAFHQIQCASWILDSVNNPLDNGAGVLVERTDGKFQYLPTNLELTMGGRQANGGGHYYYYMGYGYVGVASPPGGNILGTDNPLGNYSDLAQGCQNDPSCWADTITTCGSMLDALEAADPVAQLDALRDTLENAGMLRDGDDDQYADISAWLENRTADLKAALPFFASDPFYFECPAGQMHCGSSCQLPQHCYLCRPYDYGYYYGNYDGGAYPMPSAVAVDPAAIAPAAQDEAPIALPAPFPMPTIAPPPIPSGDGGVEIPPECYQ